MSFPFGSLSIVGTTLFGNGDPRKVIVSGGCVPPVTVTSPATMPCETMLIVPVPGGTVKRIVFPTFCWPEGVVWSAPVRTVFTHPGGSGVLTVPPLTGVGGEPFGLQEGEAVGERQRLPAQVSCELIAVQLPVH